MNAKTEHGRARTALALAAVTGAVYGLAGVAGTGTASADPVSLTLTYTCPFPLIGLQPLTVRVRSDVPKTVAVGQQIPKIAIDTVDTVSAYSTKGLTAMYGATLEGTATAAATIVTPEADLPLKVPNVIDKVAIPSAGEFDVTSHGSSPALTFTQPGEGRITVGDLLLKLTPRDRNGEPTGLGTFESECAQNPGQDSTLASFTITGGGGTVNHGFALKGSTFVKAANGTAPLSGTIDAVLNPSTQAFEADLALAPTKGTFKLLGFVPATADIAFGPVGRTTGTLTGGVLTSHSKMSVRLPSVTVFGLPVGGGAGCQTATPSDVTLTSTGKVFDPLDGGPIAGTYTLPALQNCGVLTSVLSGFTAGAGNTVNATLTPKA
ncbi:DUF6801 domain-containing protein [Actinomadura scrupuli]|uniref:DUF6801 domain-containing protein n=1 Tax=Actinomadura scrupuli TaxID=559629 RepID=UPI003D990082